VGIAWGRDGYVDVCGVRRAAAPQHSRPPPKSSPRAPAGAAGRAPAAAPPRVSPLPTSTRAEFRTCTTACVTTYSTYSSTIRPHWRLTGDWKLPDHTFYARSVGFLCRSGAG
jgi:hypothetical protein